MPLPSRPHLRLPPFLPARVGRVVAPALPNIAALAAFIRGRLAEVGDTLAPLWARRDEQRTLPGASGADIEAGTATVIVAAAAPFAPSAYARARLLRQMHASGLLSDRETEQVEHLFGA